ncbi:MAG: archease [Acidimicrobiia bacterium]|nr:archease [Acidimicrobiia bacterium]NNF65226.1 archease [Acidimicrobiia bacterium]
MDIVRFELVDGGLFAYGMTLGELFENAAFGVFSQLFDLRDVSPVQSRPLVAPGDTNNELLANWIDELQAMSRLERIAPSYFVVDRVEEGGVQGSAAGEPIDQVPEMGKRLAVVARDVEVSQTPDGWWASVPFLTSGPDLRLV